MSLQLAIQDIQAKALTLSGMKEAPNYAPEAINQFPFTVTYPARGVWERHSDWKKGLHTVVTEIHIARQVLPKAIETAMTYENTFPNKIWSDPKLSNTIDTVNEIRYTFGFLAWGGERDAHIGWRFEIDMKIQSAIT
jgi:hypothetical protein